jgi:hypothetical protein
MTSWSGPSRPVIFQARSNTRIAGAIQKVKCCLAVVRFGELRPALALRDDVRENGGALDDVRALPTKRRTSRAAAASVGRWDIRPADDVYRRTRRRFARRVSVRSGRPKGQGKEISLLATLNV